MLRSTATSMPYRGGEPVPLIEPLLRVPSRRALLQETHAAVLADLGLDPVFGFQLLQEFERF